MAKLKLYDKDDGLREILENSKVTYLDAFVDVFDNHYQDQPLVKIKWHFKQVLGPIWSLERYEIDNTGVGMDDETLANDFYRNRKSTERRNSKGTGIFSLGEKAFYQIITSSNHSLREKHGVEVVSKQQVVDLWRHIQYDANDGIEFINDEITTEEALKLGIPVDEIGEKGTWSKVYFDVSEWDTNWYERIVNEIETYNMDRLKSGVVKATLSYENGLIVDPYELRGKLIPTATGPTYVDEFETGTMEYGKKIYDIRWAVRPSTKDDKDIFELYDKKYNKGIESNIAFLADYGKLEGVDPRDNLLIIYRDRNKGRDYTYKVKKMNQQTPRGILIVYVDKEDVKTTTDKSEAKLRKLDGKTYADEDRRLGEFWGRLVPRTSTTEPKIRTQLGKVLRLEEWPVIYGHPQYNLLMDFIGIEEKYRYDIDWLRKNVQVETPVESGHKKYLDIFIKPLGILIELKVGVPDGDKDLNQIVAYTVLQPGVKKVITLGISKTKKAPRTPNSEFTDEVTNTFETKLNSDDTTKHIEWKLGDLTYFGLDTLQDTVPVKLD
jgi:hypothetical protein